MEFRIADTFVTSLAKLNNQEQKAVKTTVFDLQVNPASPITDKYDVLLAVHRSYLNVMRPVLGHAHAMAHITGGGIPGNLDRSLPPTLDAVVWTDSWDVPAVFRVLQEAGGVSDAEMYRAFNMGAGMIVATDEAGAAAISASASQAGVPAWQIGVLTRGSGQVKLTQGGAR